MGKLCSLFWDWEHSFLGLFSSECVSTTCVTLREKQKSVVTRFGKW